MYIKIAFSLILAFWINTVQAKDYVLFINGIMNDDPAAQDSMENLSATLRKGWARDAIASGSIQLDYFHNPSEGFFNDRLELAAYGKVSHDALARARLTNPAATIGSLDYKAELGKYYETAINSNKSYGLTQDRVIQTLKGFSGKLIERVNAGDRLVVVGHSQGSQFIEAANAYIEYTAKLSPAKINHSLRFVGVGAVVASTPNGRYLTIKEDIAVQAYKEMISVDGHPGAFPLQPNAVVCGDPFTYVLCIDALRVFFDFLAHSFSSIYLNDNLIDSTSHTSLPALISSAIKASAAEIGMNTVPQPSSFADDFVGTALDSSVWSTETCAPGSTTVAGGIVEFDPCIFASTQGKVHFAGNKIVVEARFAGPGPRGRNTTMRIVDVATGDLFLAGDTLSNGYGAYLYGTGAFAGIGFSSIPPSTNLFKVYQVTIDGLFITLKRGDDLDHLTESRTVFLWGAAVGKTFYLEIGADGAFSPADFDWVKVTTF